MSTELLDRAQEEPAPTRAVTSAPHHAVDRRCRRGRHAPCGARRPRALHHARTWFEARQVEQAQAQALAAGRQLALNFATLDARTVDADTGRRAGAGARRAGRRRGGVADRPGGRQRDARAATAAARADLEQLLSYDHQTIAAQAAQNAALLTGPFRQEYATTMAKTIAPVAEKTKAVVRARTYEAGVMRQSGDTVTVQLFLNQAKTAQGQAQPSVDQNRVIATMRRVDGRWLVAGLSAY